MSNGGKGKNICIFFKLITAFVHLVAPKGAVWFIERRAWISPASLLLGHLSFLGCGRLFNLFLCAGLLRSYLRLFF